MNNIVDFNICTSQINFTGKGNGILKRIKYRKKVLKEQQQIIDTMNDKAVQLLNKDRPIEEQKETAIRKSLEWIFKKLGFGKKLRNGGEKVTRKKQKTASTKFDKIQRDFRLKLLMRRNPDEAKEQIMRESMEDIGRFFGNV